MKKRFDERQSSNEGERYDVDDLLGLGSQSVRKNYYPALQDRIEELEQERNRYKWLFENALHGIFQGDLSGGFLAVNPAMAQLCGYDSPQALIDQAIRLREQVFWDPSQFDRLREELLTQGRINVREARLKRADGSAVHVAITLLHRQDLGDEVVEAFVADITERHLARVKLEKLNAELELRVEERTAALQNANVGLRYQIEERERVERELVVAIEAAKEASRSKDKYLAAASHDLLQPLNAARLLVSALQDSALPEYEHRLIDRVHRALQGAEDLLADLLDIAKLDQQAIHPDMAPVDVKDLVSGLMEEFEPVARQAGLGFRGRLTSATANTDPRMLTRILRNLLSNAFRYTRNGGVFLAMRARDGELRLEVWDTGIGIAEDKLEEIFTEFHQLPSPESGARSGVGLGLAIVERMARMLGCHVDVSSRLGRGSRFVLTLPLLADGPTAAAITPAPAPGQAMLEGCSVLVIDNEPDILESMSALLSRWGCEVWTAGDQAEALARCHQRGAPQAILADYHLNNDRTGREAIRALRQACDQDIPAAILTADRDEAVRRALKADNLPLLNKPVKPNRLRALITSLMARDNRVPL